ncbi:hypothetical protein BGX23_002783, partial [Mortierella sp. AD031]
MDHNNKNKSSSARQASSHSQQSGEQMGRVSDMSHQAHGKAQAQAQSAGHQQ